MRVRSASSTQSVERALAVLSCFSDQSPRLRGSELARRLGVSASTVSRLLATLERLGYLERESATGLYQLGLALITLGGVALNQKEVRRQAIQEMHDAVTALGLGVNLGILDQDTLFYLANVNGPRAPKLYTMVGKRNPRHCTAMGKVLLAHQPGADLDRFLQKRPLEAFTPHTITDPEALRRELVQARTRGYATEREELAFGRGCVAAPIRGAGGQVVGALSISGPLSELDLEHRLQSLGRTVIEYADRVSHKLGYGTVVPSLALG